MNRSAKSNVRTPDLFLGGGEMGDLIPSIDWSQTPVGDFDQWPPSLRSAISIILNSPLAMCIAWGKDLTQLYNDPFRSILGDSKHPHALGDATSYTFKETWHIIGPLFNQ
ncbi:MAG TPA: hypothetical protein VKA49_12815, partial [Flavitalea sp.]|nr:hypothetical protein [Flavitalea sp.]